MGYRWYDQQNKDPLFPFGHGMSYANFSYSNLQVKKVQIPLVSFMIIIKSISI